MRLSPLGGPAAAARGSADPSKGASVVGEGGDVEGAGEPTGGATGGGLCGLGAGWAPTESAAVGMWPRLQRLARQALACSARGASTF
ncbi:MAG: hypothetical protein U1E25_01925 [Methylocystis sp.]